MSKKLLWIFGGVALAAILLLAFRGCGDKVNAAFEPYATGAPDGALAVVVTQPDDALLSTVTTTFAADKNGEKLVVIPKKTGSTVSIEPVRLEGEELVALPAKFVAPEVPNNWSVLIKAIRPEGMPMWQVTVSGQGGTASYVISYNGKTGNAPVEYIVK